MPDHDSGYERQVEAVLERAASMEAELAERVKVLEAELAACRRALHRLHAGAQQLFPGERSDG